MKSNGLTLAIVLVTFTAALWVTYGPWTAVLGSFLGHMLISIGQAIWETAEKMRMERKAQDYIRPVGEGR